MVRDINQLLADAVAAVDRMTPDERSAMYRRQADSWARSAADWPVAKYTMVNGVKVYASYEDYCNG